MTDQVKRSKAAPSRQDGLILCPPDAAGRSLPLRLLGTLCRLLTIACAAGGLSAILVSAFFPNTDWVPVLGVCLATVMVIGWLRQHPVATAIGAPVSLGIVVYYLLSQPYGADGYLWRVLGYGFNAVMDRLYKRGYYGAINHKVSLPSGGIDLQAEYIEDFCALLAAVIALIFVLCLCRRAKAVLPTIVTVLMLVPLFMYNLTVDNYTVLLLIAGLSGVLILLAHDRYYHRRSTKEKDEDRTLLFPDHRPPMPEGVTDRRQLRRERRELRRQARLERRDSSPYQTVEEELDDYFKPSVRRVRQKKIKKEKETWAQHRARAAQLAAVRRYDRVTVQSRAAMGGFASVAMTLLAATILLIPAITVEGSFKTIDSIDSRVEVYREYVTALLRGDDASIDMYEYLESIREQEPHSTTAEVLQFDEILLMRIGAQYSSNVYMPSFIGVDYESGAWQYFNDDQYATWRELYGKDDMPSEHILMDFLTLMDHENEAEMIDYVTRYRNRSQYGYVSYMLNVQRYHLDTTEALLPRVYSDNYGMLQYFSNEKLEIPVSNVFDGLCVGRDFGEEDAVYSVVAYVPTHKDADAYITRAEMIAKYNELYQHTQGYGEAQIYADFVYDTYLSDTDSAVLDAYIDELLQKMAKEKFDIEGAVERNSLLPATYEQRHLLVMEVIDKLVLENTYTREPTLPTDASLDGVENFLSVTHEGYCVQFASAAALILRELGIPARYVEGYMASDFELDIYGVQGNRYYTDVRDSDAHAWVEVWYDGVGWVVYETTPPYYVDMYGENSDTAGELIGSGAAQHPDEPDTTPDEPEVPPIEPDQPPEVIPPIVVPPVVTPIGPSIDWEAVIRVTLICLAISAVTGLIIWQIVRLVILARRAEQKRRKLAEDILGGAEHIFGDEATRAEASRALVRQTMSLLSIYGTPPERGELKDDYAKRLSFAYESVLGYPMEYSSELQNAMTREHISKTNIGGLMDAIAAEEFGYGMSPASMKKLAEFYLTLREQDKQYVKAWKRFKLHYIKRQL